MNSDKKPFLVSIDMQRGFDLGGQWPPRWNTACDENGLELLSFWRSKKWPVIHVRHDSTEPDSLLRPGQEGNDFRKGYGPLDDELLITKSVNSAFIGTNLDAQLQRLGAETLVFFGITTDQCVSTTVRMASNLGWSCTLVEDACDCFDMPATDGRVIPAIDIHAAHVATLSAEFCHVTTTKQLISTWVKVLS